MGTTVVGSARWQVASLACGLAGILLAGCARHHANADAPSGSSSEASGARDRRRDGVEPPDGPACLATELVAEIANPQPVANADVLFVVDDSGSMAEEQASLVDQFPRFIDRMIGPNGLPIASLHLAVVSSDLGLPDSDAIDGCSSAGDDGLFLHAPRTDRLDCEQSYPPFLSYAPKADRQQAVADLTCISSVGTNGCGFEQPLESALKALWPARDERVRFVDIAGDGRGVGHGDGSNAGFLRRSAEDAGLLAVILVSDEDDCSSRDLRHFTPSQLLDPDDPRDAELMHQGLNTRCHFNPQELFEPSRYVNGFKALHPFNEQSVIFGAIVGVPPDALGPRADPTLAEADPALDEGYFRAVLDHPLMQEVVDDQGTPDPADDSIRPSCATARGITMPPRRIVQVAQGFGVNGLLGSACSFDYSAFFDDLMLRFEHVMGGGGVACLPQPIARNDDGTIDCEVYWELPVNDEQRDDLPSNCESTSFPFLAPPVAAEATSSAAGRQRCLVTQLPVHTAADGTAAAVPADRDGTTIADGWFYDDFSDAALGGCDISPKQRISFSDGARPPPGVMVTLQCFVAEAPRGDDAERAEPTLEQPQPQPNLICSAGARSADSSRVGDPCHVNAGPTGFDPREIYVEVGTPQCGGGVCAVDQLDGIPQPCQPKPDTSCASAEETAEHVYCTCRCDAPDGFEQCACPDGFSCSHVLTEGGDDLRGGYCLRARAD